MKAHIENLTPFKTKIKILLIKFAVAIPFAAIVADRVAHAFGICLGVH